MLQHPGIDLQLTIKEKGLTQKAFALILGKKVSEVNELLKGKRNITIQWDYSLHKALGTPIKYWILKQIDYDYSLIDTDDLDKNIQIDGIGTDISEKKEESASELNQKLSEASTDESVDVDTKNEILEQNLPQSDNTLEEKNIDNEDFKKRAKIFRSF